MDSQKSVLGKTFSEKSMDTGAEPLSSNSGIYTYWLCDAGGFANLSVLDIPHL